MPRNTKVDLHERTNPECRKCRRLERLENSDDGICERAHSVVDGGAVRCVGNWANQKLHFLTQYFGIFGPGMNAKWEGNVHYVELCSGSGRCVIRDTGLEMDGSPLAVLQHWAFPAFATATFLDYNPAVITALTARIERLNLQDKAHAFQADYNDPDSIVHSIGQRIVKGLSLVFIDPTDCSVPFDTVASIADHLRSVDFIINMAVRTDATRNIKHAIFNEDSESRAKYIKFLGGEAFFKDPEVQEMARLGRDAALRVKFRDHYSNRMRQIRYQHFDFQPVEYYYDLLFASRHELGLTFWRRAQKHRFDGQSTLDL
jgi:three-Cys-motif partner protein